MPDSMSIPTLGDYRTDMNHYWTRLMWYRDELWKVTNPIFTAYGAFIVAMFGYLFAKEASIDVPRIINMIVLLSGVTFILIRLYFIYSTRIYEAIKFLNHEIEIREQRLYRKFSFFSESDESKKDFESNYRKFKVFPELHILFGIIVMMMSGVLLVMLLSMLPDDLAKWRFEPKNLILIFFIITALSGFELYIKSYTRVCDLESKDDEQNTKGTLK